jgi:hypothetical protein
MRLQPLTQADWKAQEATLKAEYDLYAREALTDKDRKLTWVYIIEGANLIGALIDGYRRKP